MLYPLRRFALISFAAVIAAVCLFMPPQVHAAPPVEIVILETMTLEAVQERTAALRQRLAETGLKQGETANIRVFNAQKDKAKGIALLRAAIAEKKPDIVVTVATVATQAGREVLKGTDIPQVFLFVSDPVGAKVIDSIGRPSKSNIAGHVHMLPRDIHLNMIMRLVTSIENDRPLKFGLLYSSYPSSVGMKNKLLAAAEKRGDVVIHTFEIEQLPMVSGLSEMLAEAKEGLKQLEAKADYIWLGEGPLGRNQAFVEQTLQMATKPVVAGASMEGARSGILVSLDSNPEDDAREAGLLIKAILRGQKPGDIPVMRTSSYRIGINLGTARTLGIDVPQDLLSSAGRDLFW